MLSRDVAQENVIKTTLLRELGTMSLGRKSYMYEHPHFSVIPWRWKQYIAPKHQQHCAHPHGAKSPEEIDLNKITILCHMPENSTLHRLVLDGVNSNNCSLSQWIWEQRREGLRKIVVKIVDFLSKFEHEFWMQSRSAAHSTATFGTSGSRNWSKWNQKWHAYKIKSRENIKLISYVIIIIINYN
jgi:hypothetical protein